MRKLSEAENQQIIKSIIRKEITSAEILMEIYDHYVSYLQEFEEQVFDKELWELDQKFTYAYCHKIQRNFQQKASKEVGKAQVEVLKKYFCLSRGLYLMGILILLTLVSFQFNKGNELNIIMISPILLLTASHMMFTYRSFKKLKLIKKIFKEQSIEIESSVGKPISERLFLPVILLQALLFVPRFFLNLEVTQLFLPQIAVIFTAIGIIYTLSLWEVWQEKSKMAII
jgi:hypothetical protein